MATAILLMFVLFTSRMEYLINETYQNSGSSRSLYMVAGFKSEYQIEISVDEP